MEETKGRHFYSLPAFYWPAMLSVSVHTPPFLYALIRIQKSCGPFPAGSSMHQGEGFHYRCLILFWESEVDNACYWQIRGGEDSDCLARSSTRPSQMWWGRVLRIGRKWAQVEVHCEGLKAQALRNDHGHAAWVETTHSCGHSRVVCCLWTFFSLRGRHHFKIPLMLKTLSFFFPIREKDVWI